MMKLQDTGLMNEVLELPQIGAKLSTKFQGILKGNLVIF